MGEAVDVTAVTPADDLALVTAVWTFTRDRDFATMFALDFAHALTIRVTGTNNNP